MSGTYRKGDAAWNGVSRPTPLDRLGQAEPPSPAMPDTAWDRLLRVLKQAHREQWPIA